MSKTSFKAKDAVELPDIKKPQSNKSRASDQLRQLPTAKP